MNKCIVVVLGHSSIDIEQEVKEAMIPIQTILLADPGLECFAENLELQSDIVEMFLDSRFDFFDRSPEEILAELNRRVKSDLPHEEFRVSKKKRTEEDNERIQFLKSSGVISDSAPFYHDKTWEFSSPNGPEQYGCVLLLFRGPDGIVMEKRYDEEIMAGGFELTKSELVDELSEDFDSLLFLDIGCNTTNGDPREFIRRRIFGGTRNYRKIKLYSMASPDGTVPKEGWNAESEKARLLQAARQYILTLTPEQRVAYKEYLKTIYTANVMAELAESGGSRRKSRRGSRRKSSRRR